MVDWACRYAVDCLIAGGALPHLAKCSCSSSQLTVVRCVDAAQGFHPENFENQKRLWLAEEKQKQEEAARREVCSVASP
jgi:hypothetical protein